MTFSAAPVEPGFELYSGARPSTVDPSTGGEGQEILTAASLGNATALREFLAAGGSADRFRDRWQRTPLLLAAGRGHVEAVALFLEAGADPRARQNDGDTALHLARSPEVAGLLVAAGADINARGALQRTPLHAAVANDQPQIVEYLLARGAPVDPRDHAGQTPLHDAAVKSRVAIARASWLRTAPGWIRRRLRVPPRCTLRLARGRSSWSGFSSTPGHP